jgi:hypothetical protein
MERSEDQAENNFRPRRLEISNLKQQITNNFPMNERPNGQNVLNRQFSSI